MTLEEKVAMMAGSDGWHGTGIERLGVPPLKVSDGPNGVRGDSTSGATSACFPGGSALAATWNVQLIRDVGRILGLEAKSKSVQVLLGPTMNIHRTPLGGRHFESYSEDPYLSAQIAVAFTKGVQSEKVAVCLKHYVCNDSEYQRHTMSSEVSERALREIHLMPFEFGVKEGGAWSVMSAYNRINGIYASSHRELLTAILKGEWGFDGIVISDWGAAKETVGNANGGLDLEMPGPARTRGEKLVEAVRNGDVDESLIDESVRRLLKVTILTGKLDDPVEREERSEDTPERRQLTRQAAAESMVLLKNDGTLPLKEVSLKKLAVVGPNALQGQAQGGGSCSVNPHYLVHPLEAIRNRLGNEVEILYEKGCHTYKYVPAIEPRLLKAKGMDESGLLVEFYEDPEMTASIGEGALEGRSRLLWFGPPSYRRGFSIIGNRFSARLSGLFTPDQNGVYTFGLMSAGLSRIRLDGDVVVDNWAHQTAGDSFFGNGTTEVRAEASLEAGRSYQLTIEYRREDGTPPITGLRYGVLPPVPADMTAKAEKAAAEADGVILVVGSNSDWETEGNDREDMSLPGDQADLIERICRINPNTVVVLNAGSPVEMPWFDSAPAVLQSWFPGQEFGNALADILFGDVNPSGKMPTTVPFRLEDTPAFTCYPGENNRVLYGEDLFAGYRWYDKRDIRPRVPFGHGLSYTTFDYGEIEVPETVRQGETVTVTIPVTNSGDRQGMETVQLYLGNPACRLMRPVKELRGFRKIDLSPGETRIVEFSLDDRLLAFWDPEVGNWAVEPGGYEMQVGASSRDIRAVARFEVV
jgi:beta-glucosidase